MKGIFEDLSGQEFSKLTVLNYAGNGRWSCQCTCGKTLKVTTGHLKDNHKTACGKDCIYPDLAGRRIGDLDVLERAETPRAKHGKYWKCRCWRCSKESVRPSRMVNQYGGHCPCTAILPQNGSALNAIISGYRVSARKRGLLFELTQDECRLLFISKCIYCGTDPAQIRHINSSTFIYNGVDRLDPTKGYIRGNVATCCKICNLRKGKMSVAEFKKWIDRVHSNFHPELLTTGGER
jgi:5-methylcytosine-specific restriction endonuclease McrA